MKTHRVAEKNSAFLCMHIARYMRGDLFAKAVWRSFDEPVSCAIISDGQFTGGLCIDGRDIVYGSAHGSLMEAAEQIFDTVSSCLPTMMTGEMNTTAEIVVDGCWRFSFIVTKYSRSSEHGFEQVEDPLALPDGESFTPFVDLKITIVQSSR